MKLMTKAIKKTLPPLGSLDGKNPSEVPIRVKFFHPLSPAKWYATEYCPKKQMFFGFAEVLPGCGELGYFSLTELERVKVMGLRVERDLYLGMVTLRDVIDGRRP